MTLTCTITKNDGSTIKSINPDRCDGCGYRDTNCRCYCPSNFNENPSYFSNNRGTWVSSRVYKKAVVTPETAAVPWWVNKAMEESSRDDQNAKRVLQQREANGCDCGGVEEVLDATTYYTDFEDDDFADLGEVLTDIPAKVLQVLKNSRVMYDWVVDQRRDPREIQLLSKAFPWLALNT